LATRYLRAETVDLTGSAPGPDTTPENAFRVTGTVPGETGAELMTSHEAKHDVVTYANRPATPVEGMVCAFSDSNTATWGATIAGSSTNHVLGYYNGTNWTVIGK
jgi:hypothetical protein